MTIDNRPDPAYGARRSLLAIILALTVGSVLFRLLIITGYNHTSLVFIGIPAVLAAITALTPTPTSATGMILKVITLALLMSGILFGEAFVCILFAAPLFYIVGLCICGIADFLRTRRNRHNPTSLFLLLLLIAPASMEGVVPGMDFERHEAVTVARVVGAPARAVAAALGRTPQFDTDLPAFFKLGFPTPGSATGGGLDAGDRRAIEFRHSHHPGTLVVEIRRSEPGHVQFAAVRDDSYITHWLSWQSAEVRWIEVAPGQTLVTWTLEYRRRLDPAWYFAPLERYGAQLAAGYLIDALGTPHPPKGGTQSPRSPQRTFSADSARPAFLLQDVFCRWFPGGEYR